MSEESSPPPTEISLLTNGVPFSPEWPVVEADGAASATKVARPLKVEELRSLVESGKGMARQVEF